MDWDYLFSVACACTNDLRELTMTKETDKAIDERMITNLTQHRLKELLKYNPDTGEFERVRDQGNKKKGDKVGYMSTTDKYMYTKIDYVRIGLHRLAWLYVYGELPKGHIDHINRNRQDNRISNLRIANRMQQRANSSVPKNNKSGFKGVSFNKQSNKWTANIQKNRKRYYLGAFNDPKAASKAYKAKAIELFGEYAGG